MDFKIFMVALCTLGAISSIHGYHILCIFPIPTSSQNLLGKGMVNALLKADYEVTWVTAFPPKESRKGLHIIDASASITPISELINMKNKPGLSFYREFIANMSMATIAVPKLKEALVKNNYDAVITIAMADVSSGFAAIQKVPWLVLSTVVLQPYTTSLVDEVNTLSTIPMIFNDFPIPMNFVQRTINTAIYSILSLDAWWHKDSTLALYEDMFGPLAAARGEPLTPLEEAVNNVAILFVNSHPSFAAAQSVPPNVVDIGGFHIDDRIEPASKDIQNILDSSTNGVVYFSMGSILKSSGLPAETKQSLLKLLGELPYTVLWKFEEELKDLPKNVHVKAWMPQAAILSHKNTKLFITHGGLLSTLEALRYGVPLLAVPVFGDQPTNAAQAARLGYAIKVDFDEVKMADNLQPALKEMISNDSYYKQAKYLSSLFNNRPVPPAELISHYVKLAIETKGAHHLRSKAKLYPFYQRKMLDQLGAALIILFVLFKLLGFLIRLVKKVFVKKNTDNKIKTNYFCVFILNNLSYHIFLVFFIHLNP